MTTHKPMLPSSETSLAGVGGSRRNVCKIICLLGIIIRCSPDVFRIVGMPATMRTTNRILVDAAQHCGVTQPRFNALLRGRVSRFSLDALVNISSALGCRVRVDLDAA